jgi:hypothetical protein
MLMRKGGVGGSVGFPGASLRQYAAPQDIVDDREETYYIPGADNLGGLDVVDGINNTYYT